MKRFSISDIETLTGIKAHTLRIWEQRYNFFTSKRSDSNIRFYDNEDLRLLLNIATLNKSGYKISKISKMPIAEIDDLVSALFNDQYNFGGQVQVLSNSVLRLDEYEFRDILNSCISEMGLKSAMDQVVFPFLRKIGFMWQVKTITIAHEHFAVHHVSNKIIAETAKLPMSKSASSKRYLLFLPFGEEHEVSLLFANYLIKENGHQVLYLQADVPLNDLSDAISTYQPHYAVSVFTQTRTIGEINSTISRVLDSKTNLPLLLIGAQLADKSVISHSRLKIFNDIEEFTQLIGPAVISLAS